MRKGNGLRALADYLHIPIEETMAIGDAENDLDIVRTAGIGVAMANGDDCVKNAADFVTRSNLENGVAYAIRRLILGEEVLG